jgi:predicted nuclease of predicted toxin-antitoxin system
MKIVADESVDNGIVSRLRSDIHAVSYVVEMSPAIMDEEVLLLASEDNTLLVTADKEFGELINISSRSYEKRNSFISSCRVEIKQESRNHFACDR